MHTKIRDQHSDAQRSHTFLQRKGPDSVKSEAKKPFVSRPPLIQPKLTVGQPGDKYEKEADAMADHIMRMPQADSLPNTPDVQACGCKTGQCSCKGKSQSKNHSPFIQKKGNKPYISRKPTFIQRMGNIQGTNPPEELDPSEVIVQRKQAGTPQVGSDLEQRLKNTHGKGTSLPRPTLQKMENAFGQDLSQVKIHQDPSSIQMNQELNAQAFTHGSDIYFNQGKYQPGTETGDHLLGHELTHVVQQSNKGANDKSISNIQTHAIQKQSKGGGGDTLGQIRQTLEKGRPGPNEGGASGASADQYPNKSAEDQTKIISLWKSFSITKLGAIVEENGELWELSKEFSPGLMSAISTPIIQKFKSDVIQTAQGYLKENENFILEELANKGLSEKGDIVSTSNAIGANAKQGMKALLSQEQIDQVQETKRNAEAAKILIESIQKIEQTKIGFDQTPFNPNHKPKADLPSFVLPNTSHWELLHAQWTKAKEFLGLIATNDPSLMVAITKEPKMLNNIIKSDPEKDPIGTLEQIRQPLLNILTNVRVASGNIQNQSVDYRDLKPIHDQFFGGMKGSSGLNFSDPFYQSLVKEDISSYESEEYWKKLGLELASYAVMVVGALSANPVLIASLMAAEMLLVDQTEEAYKKDVQKMQNLNNASVLPNTALAYKGQLSAAEAELAAYQIRSVVISLAINAPSMVGMVKMMGPLVKAGLSRTAIILKRFRLELALRGEVFEQIHGIRRGLKSAEAAKDLPKIVKLTDELSLIEASLTTGIKNKPAPITGKAVFNEMPHNGKGLTSINPPSTPTLPVKESRNLHDLGIVSFGKKYKREAVFFWEDQIQQQQHLLSKTNSSTKKYQEIQNRITKYEQHIKNIRNGKQPSPQQAEMEMQHFYGTDEMAVYKGREITRSGYEEIEVIENGQKVKKKVRRTGSSKPDLGNKGFCNIAGEVKCYKIENKSDLIRELNRQIGERKHHLPYNIKQQAVILDMRGQHQISIDELLAFRQEIIDRVITPNQIPVNNLQIITW